MNDNTTPPVPSLATKVDFQSIINTMVQIMTDPVTFFRTMPKSSGFSDPIIFLLVMGLMSGILQAILNVSGLGDTHGSVGTVLVPILIVPFVMFLFGFVVAAAMFVTWKLMGSEESYEVAFRCIAYAGALGVVTTALGVIPYIGAIAGLVWTTYLMIIISIEVHQIDSRKAWIVFGVTCLVFALISIGGEYQAKKLTKRADEFSETLEKRLEDMTPEEAGKAVGEFLKGMQETVEPQNQ